MSLGDASDTLLTLRAELAEAREQARQAQSEALVAQAHAARVAAINADLVARNAHLELINAKMRRDRYGTSSERTTRLLEQLEIAFEDLEADAAAAELDGEIAAARTTTVA